MEYYSCRQTDYLLSPDQELDDWTEDIIPGNSEAEAAENFCESYVLDGDPPYQVEVRLMDHGELIGGISSFSVEQEVKPVYRATPIKKKKKRKN